MDGIYCPCKLRLLYFYHFSLLALCDVTQLWLIVQKLDSAPVQTFCMHKAANWKKDELNKGRGVCFREGINWKSEIKKDILKLSHSKHFQ